MQKAEELAATLELSGDLMSPQWRQAVADVPRHELIPYYFTQNPDAGWAMQNGIGTDPDTWLSTIYSDTTLITALIDVSDEAGPGQQAVSSSTMPSVMVRMLEALDVQDGHRVLEIGTGTGYNAALLSHRLGSHNVFSVDVEDQLVESARKRLESLGYTPTLVTRDGEQGLSEFAEFDRIIATCAVPAIPRPWIDQTKQGGQILTDFKPSGMAGNLVLLTRDGDAASGRFLPAWAGFMDMRHVGTAPIPRHPRRRREDATLSHSTAPGVPWMEQVPWFLAQFGMPEHLTFGQGFDSETGRPSYAFLSSTDGSWCEIGEVGDDGTRPVWEGGPESLWFRFEVAYQEWRDAGEPDWPRFGLTVTPENHTVWLDAPTGRKWLLNK